MNNIVEGNVQRNNDLIKRLHGIIRPFLLRRLKKDVEAQMPGKYEHVIKCQLSRRQMFLYEEFMSRSSTRKSMGKGGNFMGMMNVLMQLRKVCNHPDLFEPRPILTPFVSCQIVYTAPVLAATVLRKDPLSEVSKGLVEGWFYETAFDGGGVTRVRELLASKDVMVVVEDYNIRAPNPNRATLTGLKPFLQKQWQRAKEKEIARVNCQHASNETRANNMLHEPLYDWRLKALVNLGMNVFERTHLWKGEREECGRVAPEIVDSTPLALTKILKSPHDRSVDMREVINKFVFCVPKAGALKIGLNVNYVDHVGGLKERSAKVVLEKSGLTKWERPFKSVKLRLSSFFPDKKLVQFDAGKLQRLAELLRKLKAGGHRALIFTQMSKMLDILEQFLNLNSHTYLRLDGGTGVDKRQRLMDKFNADDKIFCFILSTRSGGLGINLTGADSVIFYDSDWNPAMDAQAQDRAHRIGQTRDVHIYRLVTESTIEENILIKARQKRELDMIVMDEGKFTAGNNANVFSKGGLKELLGNGARGVTGGKKGEDDEEKEGGEEEDEEVVDAKAVEAAMANAEDAEDVAAANAAKLDAAADAAEFDENAKVPEGEGEEGGKRPAAGAAAGGKAKKAKTNEKTEAETEAEENKKLEEEFAAWQSKVRRGGAEREAGAKRQRQRSGRLERSDSDSGVSPTTITDRPSRSRFARTLIAGWARP